MLVHKFKDHKRPQGKNHKRRLHLRYYTTQLLDCKWGSLLSLLRLLQDFFHVFGQGKWGSTGIFKLLVTVTASNFP